MVLPLFLLVQESAQSSLALDVIPILITDVNTLMLLTTGARGPSRAFPPTCGFLSCNISCLVPQDSHMGRDSMDVDHPIERLDFGGNGFFSGDAGII